jgi:adenylylsulfate reductase subunit B
LVKRFKFPIRTTPEGAANDYASLKGNDLNSNQLATEEADGKAMPTPQV